MARSRNIKPGFFTNDQIAEMTPWARLTFIGLWTLADKAGRMLYRPKKIKMELFPGDSIDVVPLIEELVQHGFIEVYDADGVMVLSVINFTKHQNPHPKEKPTELPPKTRANSTSRGNTRQDAERIEQVAESSERAVLIPDVLIPDCGFSESDASASGADAPEPEPAPTRKTYPEHFETFWREFPTGHGVKKQAFEQWKKIPAAERQAVMDGLAAWKACERWQQGYVKAAERWLRDRQWEDDPPPPKRATSLTVHNGGRDAERDAAFAQAARDLGLDDADDIPADVIDAPYRRAQ